MKVINYKINNRFIDDGISKNQTRNENNATKLIFDIPEKYEDYNKKIVFITKDGVVWDLLDEDNSYLVTYALTKYKEVEFYIWLTKDDEDFRTQTRTIKFIPNVNANEEISEEEITGVNKIVQILENEITKVTDLESKLTNLITTVEENEEAREIAETNRISAEELRNTAELERNTAEETRINNETARQSAEKIRQANETIRIASEKERQANETTRQSAEETRQNSEQERIEAENAREEYMNGFKEEQETQNANIEDLGERVEDIENNWIIGTTETDTSLYISDSANMRCEMSIEGNSTQETSTEGNNLCPPITDNRWVLIKGAFVNDSGYLELPNIDAIAYIDIDWNMRANTLFVYALIPTGGNILASTYYFGSNGENLGNNGDAVSNKEENYEYSWGVHNTSGTAKQNIANSKSIRLRFSSTSTYGSNPYTVTNIMVSTTKLDYEEFMPIMPSIEYPSEIKSCGYNIQLFDKDNANVLNAFINQSSGAVQASDISKLIFIECEPNETYTVSRIPGNRFSIATTDDIPVKGLCCNEIKQDNNANSITIETSSTAKFLLVWYYTGTYDNNEQEILDSIKIEKGSKATPYSPYKMGSITEIISNEDNSESQSITIPVQAPFRAIGDVRDTFEMVDGVWNEKHLPYIENYADEELPEDVYTLDEENGIKYCNEKSMSTTGQFSEGASVVYIDENNWNYIECTEEQIEVLNALEKVKTYKNVTNIYSTDEIVPYITVKYKKDLETYIKNLLSTNEGE